MAGAWSRGSGPRACGAAASVCQNSEYRQRSTQDSFSLPTSEHVVHEREMRSIKIVRDVHRYFGRDYPLAALFPGFYAGMYRACPSITC